MAIIYTYPNLPLSSLSADDLLVITNVDAANNNPTRSVTLADIATYVTGTGSGTGTTNKIVKFTDGANGLLGDSIMTESAGLIDLAGQFVSTSSPTLTQAAPVSGIKAILNGTTAAPNVALYGESKNTGSTQADSNYGLFAKGEFEGTGGFTGFVIGGNLEGRYDGTGTNGANATIYGSYNLARATTAANGTISYMVGANNLAKLEGANVTATNLQGTHSTVELSNGTAGDVIVQILDFDGTGGTVTGDLSYLQIQNDTMPTVAGTKRAINSKSVLPSLFTGQVEIPLVPTINAHATSKQYVDQQISSVVSGLVFISTWDASSTPGGNPDLTDVSTQVVGHYYVVSVAGSATPNGAGTLPNSWNVGDWCIYVEQGATDRWEKLDQTFVSGAGAAGQVTYWNSQNEVAGDNDLFFDSTNKRLGIGTNTPVSKLETKDGNIRVTTLNAFSNLISSRAGVPNAGGYNTGGLLFQAYSTGTTFSTGAAIYSYADGAAWTATSVPSYLSFQTVPSGLTGLKERMRIDSAGDISIFPRAAAASSGSGILYFKNVDDNSATINGASIRTVDSNSNPSGADMRFQVANDAGTLFDAVAIDSNGFMGIGTTAPDYPLDVSGVGAIRISNGTSNSVQLIIDNSNTTDAGTETSEIRFRHYRSYVAGQNDAGSIIVGKEEPWDAAGDRNSYMSFSTRTGTSGATEKMRIDSSGNVGIGTTNPGYKLDVSGNGIRNIRTTAGWAGWFENTGNSSGVIVTAGVDSGDAPLLVRKQDGTELFSVRGNGVSWFNGGNVGIGTVNPTTKLEINADNNGTTDLNLLNLKRTWSSGTSTDRSHGILFSDSNSSMATIYADRTNSGANYNSDLLFATNTGANGTDLSTKMIIKNTGNVGIGTTSPLAGLTVTRPMSTSRTSILYLDVDGANNNGGGGEIIFNTSATSGNLTNYNAKITATRVVGDGGDSELGFWTTLVSDNVASQQRMVITKEGNVGIGTTSPTDTLTISNDNNLLLGLNSPVGNDAQLRFYSAGSYKNIIYRPANSNDLRFNTSTSGDVLTIQQDGNVGIGITSPSAKLQVQQIANTTATILANGDYGIIIEGNDSGTAGESVGLHLAAKTVGSNPVRGVSILGEVQSTSNDHDMLFATSAGGSAPQERMRIDSAGDVSLEKTTGSVFNFRRNDTTVVAGDGLGSIFFQGNDPSNPYKSGAAILAQGDGTWNMGTPNVYPSRLIFQTAEENTLKTAMVIKSDQKVGIGTTTPSYTLVVSDNGGSGVEFIPQTTNNRTTLLSYNRSGSVYSTLDFDASDIHFNISGYERMKIDSSSTTKITSDGTNIAGTILELHFPNNNSTDRCTTINFTNNVGGYAVIEGGTTGANNSGYIAFKTDNAGTQGERMRIDPTGNVLFGTTGVPNGTSIYGSGFLSTTNERMALVQATDTTSLATMQTYYNPNGAVGSIKTTGSATQFNTSSDYRLKKDLKDFDGLDKVSKIPVYDFKWKVDDSSSYGVMAHELQDVLPDAVSGEKDGEEMQGVDYSKVVPLLIKSIQELEAKVKILENK